MSKFSLIGPLIEIVGSDSSFLRVLGFFFFGPFSFFGSSIVRHITSWNSYFLPHFVHRKILNYWIFNFFHLSLFLNKVRRQTLVRSFLKSIRFFKNGCFLNFLRAFSLSVMTFFYFWGHHHGTYFCESVSDYLGILFCTTERIVLVKEFIAKLVSSFKVGWRRILVKIFSN